MTGVSRKHVSRNNGTGVDNVKPNSVAATVSYDAKNNVSHWGNHVL